MKYLITALLVFAYTLTMAQTDVYLQFKTGAGISAIKLDNYLAGVKHQNITSYNGGFNISYRLNKWHLGIGLSYLRTGFRLNDIVFMDTTGKPADTASFSYTFSHLLMPLSVGYELNTGKRFSIIPAIAIVPTYNAGRTSYLDATNSKGKTRDTKNSFDSLYKRILPAGMVEVKLQYRVSPLTDIVVIPSYYYMFDNMLKEIAVFGPFTPVQRNSAIFVSVGINYRLGR